MESFLRGNSKRAPVLRIFEASGRGSSLVQCQRDSEAAIKEGKVTVFNNVPLSTSFYFCKKTEPIRILLYVNTLTPKYSGRVFIDLFEKFLKILAWLGLIIEVPFRISIRTIQGPFSRF